MNNQNQSSGQKLYSEVVEFFKRKLSALQQAYKAFIASMLKSFEVDSIEELNEEQKHDFFKRVESEWEIKKQDVIIEEDEEIIEEEKVDSPSKKETYASLKVTRPPIALEPERAYNPTDKASEELTDSIEISSPQKVLQYERDKVPRSTTVQKPKISETVRNSSMGEGSSEIILSKENPDQSDDLKIKYHPNRFFEQDELYTYPVVKMPRVGSYLKLPRKGRAMSKGYKENDFYRAILDKIPEVEVKIDFHMAIPYYNKPYEPDIVLINQELNLYIDIEIDEPYDGYYRYPTHCFNKDDDNDKLIKKDDTRDLFFNESGWVVIRFTERQIHTQEEQCIAYIKDVINSLVRYRFEETSACISEPQWKYQQALRWEKEYYREKYLGIEKFGKQQSHSSIVVDINQTEAIEKNIVRTKKLQLSIPQDNVAFEEESHVYHHAKDATGNAEYISVTTLIDRFFPFDMDRFIQTKARREERDEEDILNEFIEMRDEASETGTFLHEQIEHFLKGEPYKTSKNLTDGNKRIDISKEFEMFKVFHQQIVLKKGFEFIEAEKVVLLDDYNVAGTIDALFKKPNKDEYLIVDWKRSKKLVVDGHPKKYGYGYALSELSHLDNSSYYKYALQQNIYKYMLEKKYGMSVSSMNLIVLHEKFDMYHRVNLVNMDKEVSVIFNSINHKI